MPALTNGIPPPTTERVGITNSDDQVLRGEFISPPQTGIPETSSSASNETGSLGSPLLTPLQRVPPRPYCHCLQLPP